MEVIDGTWIKKRLTDRHGEKAELARAIGISPAKVSLILSGERRVQPEEIPRVLAYFGATKPDTPAFAETAIEPFEARADTLALLGRVLASGARHLTAYVVRDQRPFLNLGAGDVLLVDIGSIAKPGETVIATITDPDHNTAVTQVFLMLDNWLVAGPNLADRVAIKDDHTTGVLGVVRGCLRSMDGNVTV